MKVSQKSCKTNYSLIVYKPLICWKHILIAITHLIYSTHVLLFRSAILNSKLQWTQGIHMSCWTKLCSQSKFFSCLFSFHWVCPWCAENNTWEFTCKLSRAHFWTSFINDLISYETMLRIQYVSGWFLYKTLVTAQSVWGSWQAWSVWWRMLLQPWSSVLVLRLKIIQCVNRYASQQCPH